MRKLKKYLPTRFMASESHYDKDAADYAVNFIECLCHTKGSWAGKPFELIDWQEQIIRDLFGTIKPNGYRQFNYAYIEIPKKMGKSELAAAIALLLCCGDGEERAEVYGCAADRQQASIVFEVAADMVRMCPALNKRVKILASQKRIVYTPTNSFYQVLSAEAYSKHGFNIHGVVFDELHTQPNRKLFDVMTKGSGDARMQPLYFLITTAGTDTNSICYETHQKAKDIMEGRKIDPTFYPVIYGADENDDWTDPKVWKKANPSLGITVGIDKVQAACESAKQNPAEENSFRQLRLNQWVKQAVRWMPMEKWDKCSFPANPEALEGRVCYGGLDLSSTTDITAFVLVFPPEDEDDKYAILPFFWIPEDNIDLRVRRVDGEYAGAIVLEDTVKPGARTAMEDLHALGIKNTCMLTGDREAAAKIAAKELCMTDFRSGLLPQDKLTAVQDMLDGGRTVAFVGDGVNDAPVLSAAQVGVAMGGVGSDAAVEASDLVLLKDDLAGLPKALKIARRTISIARQNIAFALLIKFGVMLLSIPGIANMWMAVFADVGVAMICILNSFRAMKSDV